MQDTCSLGVFTHFKVKSPDPVKVGAGFLFHRQRQLIVVSVPAVAFLAPKPLNFPLDILCGIPLSIGMRWAIRSSPLPKCQADDLKDLCLIDDGLRTTC
ncbi:hypothetical protein [Microcoleus sp. FACHB-68]|uniref:hypothetical protein n=1 Tax=Microcoleus sp. FACHB-68 TaxID=2692826 RepID=UPI001689B8A2|nr:hypothetical protein [Microcoleus sp. FACHB-68]MBD1940239.1 hypothetical protein [Microcoleus sp. FACHB-68]